MTNTLSTGPAIDGEFFRMKFTTITFKAFWFSDRSAGHPGVAAALLQRVQLLCHLDKLKSKILLKLTVILFPDIDKVLQKMLSLTELMLKQSGFT
jgi:hypothetical protein